MTRRFAAVATAFVVMPIALATTVVTPGLVGRAEGCAGVGFVPPPEASLTHFGDDPVMPTDGVFMLVTKAWNSEPAMKLTTSAIVAVNAEQSSMLIDIEDDIVTSAHIYRPDNPLTPDATYFATWGPGTGPVTLHTTSLEGSKPPVPVVDAEFLRAHALRGTLIGCNPAPCTTTSCRCTVPTGTQFYDTEVLVPALTLTWGYAPTQTSVYAITTVQPVPGKGDLHASVVGSAYAGAAGGVVTKTVLFENELPEYCVRLTTLDLTDQTTITSPDICVAATGSSGQIPVTTPLLDAELAECQTAPEGMLDKWCTFHAGQPGCPPVEGDASTGSPGGSSGDPSAEGASDSGSCSVRSPGRALASWILVALTFVGWLRRRAYSAAP